MGSNLIPWNFEAFNRTARNTGFERETGRESFAAKESVSQQYPAATLTWDATRHRNTLPRIRLENGEFRLAANIEIEISCGVPGGFWLTVGRKQPEMVELVK